MFSDLEYEIDGNDLVYGVDATEAFTSATLFYSASFQSRIPLPSSSNSISNPITCRLSALNGSRYWRLRICCVAAALPPLLHSFNSMT